MNYFVSAIITAAGSSRRMGRARAKQFLLLEGKMVIERTLEVFDAISFINEIILVVRQEDIAFYKDFIAQKFSPKIRLTIGGSSREESTYRGIQSLSQEADYVICHDGARPLVQEELVGRVLEEAIAYGAAIAAVPTTDTIKFVDQELFVKYTPNRDQLMNVQTPQVFEKSLLLAAYQRVFDEDIRVTDDASLLELAKIPVKTVLGDYRNIKITTEKDLALGRILIKERKKDEDRNGN